MTNYKKYNREEVEKFCEDNFIEDEDWLIDFVIDAPKVHLSMDKKGTLIIKVKDVN